MGIRKERKKMMLPRKLISYGLAFVLALGIIAPNTAFATDTSNNVKPTSPTGITEESGTTTKTEATDENAENINQNAEESQNPDDDSVQYYDEDGNLIDNDKPVLYKDTSWFDYENPKKVYNIKNEAQLKGLVSLVNEEQSDRWKPTRFESFENTTINLVNDIKLTEDWTPIGRSENISFKGEFNGNGHTISGININENGGYAGFFGYLGGTVKNLTLEGNVKSSGKNCGAMAGYLNENGVIKRCYTHVTVKGQSMTGGICGYNKYGKIKHSVNYGSVAGTFKIGGVCGENWGTIDKCGNRGSVTSSARGATTYGTGGVAGRSVGPKAVITNSYNVGDLNSRTEGTGGVAGYINATDSLVNECYNTGNISVKNPKGFVNSIKGYAGGIVGIAGCRGVIIKYCYNAGAINNNDVSGGIIGKYYDEPTENKKGYPGIKGNMFISNGVKYGIGSDYREIAKNISEGTKSCSIASLVNGSSAFGGAYKDDTSGIYGSNGFPVLVWQSEISDNERKYLSHVSRKLQDSLNKYIKETESADKKCYTLYMFFNYNEFVSKAIGDFHAK